VGIKTHLLFGLALSQVVNFAVFENKHKPLGKSILGISILKKNIE
jgi:hypothetical protein